MVVSSQPFISILVPAYRTERYVGEAIESVLAQTRDDWELIVVDNGNSDEMARIVERYMGDPRVRLIRQENKGIRGGVTAAAQVAVGRYLCFLCSDDLLRPEFCMRVGALIDADPRIDAVGCDGEMFWAHEDGLPPRGWFKMSGWKSVPNPAQTLSLEQMLGNGVPHYLGAFRREVWDAHRAFDPAADDVEADIELWLSMAVAGRDIRVLADRLARIRQRPDSESRDPSRVEEFEVKYQQAFITVCERNGVGEVMISRSKVIRRLRYYQAVRRARWALLDGDVRLARVAAREAYRQQHTPHALALVAALQISPNVLKSIRPTKNRVQKVVSRARFRLTSGRAA